jgi:phosphoenolpyruvate phosphomutase
MKKTTQLKNLLHSPELAFLMEAHNGLSAKIAQEAGFKGLWGSGLSISASMGVRDNNEASWTQVLEVLEFMSDATDIPILLDGDTGYGNFNNMRRLVAKLEQRDVAGVCIEDKLFPKTNSFIKGEQQQLADIDEFAGKIKAAKDTQKDSDFMVVARLEAFISGWGVEEALKRALAYYAAGADAILVHSKKTNPQDIVMFVEQWPHKECPLVIVPTTYYATPTDTFRELGISAIIWANHNLRTSIKSMQQLSSKLYNEQHLSAIEEEVVSVAEVFRIQGAKELQQAEKSYLPTNGLNINSIVLAAAQGSLGELTANTPKTLLKVKGSSILEHQVNSFNSLGIKDISLVTGFGNEQINMANTNNIHNSDFAQTHDLYSLHLAQDQLKENTIISYGDILFKEHVLSDLVKTEQNIVIVVDADASSGSSNQDLVTTETPYSTKLFDKLVKLEQTARYATSADHGIEHHGEFIGLLKCNLAGAAHIKQTLAEFAAAGTLKSAYIVDLLNALTKKTNVHVQYIKGSWLDINTIADLYQANEF